MTHDEVNHAIVRLRRVNRRNAGRHSYAYARRLLPVSAAYSTPADLAALWIVAVALYNAALTLLDAGGGVRALCVFIDDRYALLQNETPQEMVFAADSSYPENLQAYIRALSQLPRSLVVCGLEVARDAVQHLNGVPKHPEDPIG